MRLATWNVNSVRSRIDRVEAFLARHDVDVLALQETKARDDQWPTMGLQAMGYEVATYGYNQWNGVAIVSRVGLEDVTPGFDDMPPYGDPPVGEARAIAATCGGVRLWSLYVPNGRTVGDPHYDYKLAWLEALRAEATAWSRRQPDCPIALGGDWNIAPQDEDVWDMKVFATSTHVTEPERAAFQRLRRRRVHRRRAPASTPARTPSPTGTTTGSASSGTRACGSTSCSAPPRSPSGWWTPSSTATSAPARARRDHAPVVVTLAD